MKPNIRITAIAILIAIMIVLLFIVNSKKSITTAESIHTEHINVDNIAFPSMSSGSVIMWLRHGT